MLRTLAAVASGVYMMVAGTWQGAELYEPGNQYPSPWPTILTVGGLTIVGVGLYRLYRRRKPTPPPRRTYRTRPYPGE